MKYEALYYHLMDISEAFGPIWRFPPHLPRNSHPTEDVPERLLASQDKFDSLADFFATPWSALMVSQSVRLSEAKLAIRPIFLIFFRQVPTIVVHSRCRLVPVELFGKAHLTATNR